jgi:excisionase family DNA binding protein
MTTTQAPTTHTTQAPSRVVASNAIQSNAALAVSVPVEFVEAVAVRVADLLAERANAAPEPWIGVEQAAAHLACGRSRLYALTSAGRIPYRKDGSRLLFRASELDGWLAGGGGIRP